MQPGVSVSSNDDHHVAQGECSGSCLFASQDSLARHPLPEFAAKGDIASDLIAFTTIIRPDGKTSYRLFKCASRPSPTLGTPWFWISYPAHRTVPGR